MLAKVAIKGRSFIRCSLIADIETEIVRRSEAARCFSVLPEMDRNSSIEWLNRWQTRRGLGKSRPQCLIFCHFTAIRPCSEGSVNQYEL
jgi:hypothetical protein